MNKINKNMLLVGSLVSVLSPLGSFVSCFEQKKMDLNQDQGIHITYWPNIDPALALGVKVDSTSKSSGHSATWFEGTKFKEKIKNIKEIKPLWDADTMDEEYWRNLTPKNKAVGLVYESWIKTPQKEFLNQDHKIVPIEFDYNMGIPHEKYHWKIKGGNIKEVLLQNKGNENYLTPGNLYQIRDMGEILKKAANSLDEVYKVKKYSKKAAEIIEKTNKHWEFFSNLQNSKKEINNETKEWESNDSKETLLIINIKTGAVSAGSNDSIAFSTPSMQKEAYTKTQFSMPEITEEQFEILKKSNNLNDNGHAVVTSRTNNGVYFPNYKGKALNDSFWKPWYNKIDKLVIGVSPAEISSIKLSDISKDYNFLNKLMKGAELTKSNTVILDTYLAGSGSYGFRMPIGQNIFIDKITESFYPKADKFEWEDF